MAYTYILKNGKDGRIINTSTIILNTVTRSVSLPKRNSPLSETTLPNVFTIFTPFLQLGDAGPVT